MTKNIWVVSDTHFNHANILRFTDSNTSELIRPGFADVTEMNEVMIQNWNSLVRPGDKVYHLGDVFFGDHDYFKRMWPRLMGSKRLIVGNHDDIPFLSSGGFFQKVQMWRIFAEFNILMSHVPLHESGLYRNRNRDTPMLNVHGHIHQNKSPKGPYHCACVEQTNYTPVHIEDLAKIAREI
jgi:calcineurin-like phosphoesterase family protein